jgi:hypothetical protein
MGCGILKNKRAQCGATRTSETGSSDLELQKSYFATSKIRKFLN